MSIILPEIQAGLFEFSEIRETNVLYVDKTGYIPLLKKRGKIIFLARPRRFGKSLTVSTLEAFYSGRRDLFAGLEAEEYLNAPDFQPKPVIRLDMSKLTLENLDIFKSGLVDKLAYNAKQGKVPLRGMGANNNLSNLIEDLHEAASQPVVLLIDEYDSPRITLQQKRPELWNIGLIEGVRDFLQDFYKIIKGSEKHLHFTFITGVTKFSRMSVFSVLNNLEDISLDSDFGAIVGFTQEELDANFAPHVEAAAGELGLESPQLSRMIRDYYDGFSFDGETLLYNPYSTLLFFEQTKKRFSPFWVKSGSDTLIREKLLDWNFTPERFVEGRELPKEFFEFPGEIGQTSPLGFLYQAGYLSLRKKSDYAYTTVYPNLEVRESVNRLFLASLYRQGGTPNADCVKLFEALAAADVPEIIGTVRRQLFSLSYQRYAKAIDNPMSIEDLPNLTRAARDMEETGSERNMPDIRGRTGARSPASAGGTKARDFDESHYRDLIQMCLGGAGCDVTAERNTSIGRIDLEARFRGQVFVIELKIMGTSEGAAAAAERAFRQIVAKKYDAASISPILIGIAIDPGIRNIAGCVYEKNGARETLDCGDA
jgi:hypothetical protein